MRQFSLTQWLIIAGIIAAAALIIGSVTGIIPWNSVTGQLIAFIFMIVIIAFLAVIGAAFVGMFISHRILSNRGFTPFEQRMLEMSEEVKTISKRLETVENELKNKRP